jgi:hypothetical protein
MYHGAPTETIEGPPDEPSCSPGRAPPPDENRCLIARPRRSEAVRWTDNRVRQSKLRERRNEDGHIQGYDPEDELVRSCPWHPNQST